MSPGNDVLRAPRRWGTQREPMELAVDISALDFNMVGTIDEVRTRHEERQKANAAAAAGAGT